jgi:hypothetical protein
MAGALCSTTELSNDYLNRNGVLDVVDDELIAARRYDANALTSVGLCAMVRTLTSLVG